MAVTHQLAQVNLAFAREPLDAPLLADFMAALDPVNAAADSAQGFVWRMQTDDGNATAIRGFGGHERLIINMSVWESLEALRSFVFSDPAHLAIMRRRREWFERLELHTALWWVRAGHRPDITEAEDRMAHLREHGLTPAAFGFRLSFPLPGTVAPPSGEGVPDDRPLCPA